MLIIAPTFPSTGVQLAAFAALLAAALAGMLVPKACRFVKSSAQYNAKDVPDGFRGHIRADERATVRAMNTRPAPTPDTVLVSAHAAEQYRDRVEPGLDLDAARGELEQLRLAGEISPVEPAWVNARKALPYYLLLGDAIVLPLAPQREGWVATTCVTQRTLTPTRRAAKTARKASLGARNRAERRARF